VTKAYRSFQAALALLAIIAVSACASAVGGQNEKNSLAKSAYKDDGLPQPPIATYACADGGMMTIRNLGTSIRLIGPNGFEKELPASPVDQRSRYGEVHDAIVLDAREALVMKAGQEPLTCTR
jgi:hypothetical protein